jgi:hypothetical protein
MASQCHQWAAVADLTQSHTFGNTDMWKLRFHPYTMFQTFIIVMADRKRRKEKVKVLRK